MVTAMTEMPISPRSVAPISPATCMRSMLGVDLKPTDTTTIKFDAYYIGMVEDRTVGGENEDEIGIEVDARLTQKIYDTLSLTVLGAYLFAEDGYGSTQIRTDGSHQETVAVVTMPSRLASASTSNSKEA